MKDLGVVKMIDARLREFEDKVVYVNSRLDFLNYQEEEIQHLRTFYLRELSFFKSEIEKLKEELS